MEKKAHRERGGPQKIRFAKLQSFIAGFEKVDGEMLTDGFGFMVHKGLQGKGSGRRIERLKLRTCLFHYAPALRGERKDRRGAGPE